MVSPPPCGHNKISLWKGQTVKLILHHN
uniref:Uncharacterized protein n=1 Tax=Anguilla anguilla TaxID=7936 RepID=A0A0E9SGU3_ANGAN